MAAEGAAAEGVPAAMALSRGVPVHGPGSRGIPAAGVRHRVQDTAPAALRGRAVSAPQA